LLELAIELTPLARKADLRRRKLAAADAHFTSGAIEPAARILAALSGELPPGEARAAVLLRLARATADLETSLALAHQAEMEVRGNEALMAEVHLQLGTGWPLHGIDYAIRQGRLAVGHARQARSRRLVSEALARLSLWQLWAGGNPSVSLRRAVDLDDARDARRGYANPRFTLALLHMYQGRLRDARGEFEALLAEALDHGDEIESLAVRGRLVDVALRAGAWTAAQEHAATAYELAEQIGIELDAGFTFYWVALVDAHLGRVQEARSKAELGTALADAAKRENTRVMNLGLLGFLELSQGNETAALKHLEPLLRWLHEKGMGLATHPLAPHALEALVAAGEVDQARDLTARFESQARGFESA
jgi:hypothetical protein